MCNYISFTGITQEKLCRKEVDATLNSCKGLASLCSVANVEIISRAHDSFETYIASYKGGKLINLKLAAEQQSRQGTRVCVKDLFYNRPICRQALNDAFGMNAASSNIGLQEILTLLQAYALMNNDVRFTMYERTQRRLILKHIHGRCPMDSAVAFFGPSIAKENIAFLKPCTNHCPEYRSSTQVQSWSVKGWISRPPFGHPTKAKQVLFVKGKRCKAPRLAQLIDAMFADLCKQIYKLETGRRMEELLTVRKSKNKYPIYCIQLDGQITVEELVRDGGSYVLNLSNCEKLWVSLERSLSQAWQGELSLNFLDQSNRKRAITSIYPVKDSIQPRAQYYKASRKLEAYGSSKVKEPLGVQRSSAPSIHSASSSSSSMYLNEKGKNESRGRISCPNFTENSMLNNNLENDKSIKSWRHRRHNSSFSGVPVAEQTMWATMTPTLTYGKGLGISTQMEGGILGDSYFNKVEGNSEAKFSKIKSSVLPSNTSTLDDLLSRWKNPVMLPVGNTNATCFSSLTISNIEATLFYRIRPDSLKRSDLNGARALRQVDFKYVPIVTRSGIVALLDQHAADERVQLEKLRSDIIGDFGGPKHGTNATFALQKPQILLLGAEEIPLLDSYQDMLKTWGWRWQRIDRFDSQPNADENKRQPFGQVALEVTHCPLISGRSLSVTDMRLYLHEISETRASQITPSGVIRVLNSKSCRTAIMFGDELSEYECQHLASSLSNTQMSFVCAHGRPTTFALANLKALDQAKHALRDQVDKTHANGRHASRWLPLDELKSKIIDALHQ